MLLGFSFSVNHSHGTRHDWLGSPAGQHAHDSRLVAVFSKRQQSVGDRISTALTSSNINLMTVALGNDAILASTASGWGMAGSHLPNDQWMRELDHWNSIFWNSVQLHIAEYAVGNGVAAQDRYRISPAKEDQWMCQSQVVQRSDHASFKMLGVLLILCFGVFFLILSLTIDPLYQYVRKRRARAVGIPWLSLWRRHHVPQILTVAFDAAGLGQWDHDEHIPTTITKERFRFPLGRSQGYTPVEETGEAGSFTYENKLPDQSEVSVPSSASTISHRAH